MLTKLEENLKCFRNHTFLEKNTNILAIKSPKRKTYFLSALPFGRRFLWLLLQGL